MVPDRSTRRQIIGAEVASALPIMAGCSALSSAEPGVELGQVGVENADESPHEIHVVVERESELVYGFSHELEAVSAPEDGGFGSIDGTLLKDAAWNVTVTDWVIYTRVDDRTAWKQHEIPADDETECRAVRLKFDDDSAVTSFAPDCDSWPPDGDR